MSLTHAIAQNRCTVVCLLIIACLSAGTRSNAQNPPAPTLTPEQTASIAQYVSAEMAREHIPGAEVGIYHRGQILLAKGYGLADVELEVPVKPEIVFQSGSVGKQFVSAAIMMLVEEGKIGLDDSITKYSPTRRTVGNPFSSRTFSRTRQGWPNMKPTNA